jgi:hypothetical protein
LALRRPFKPSSPATDAITFARSRDASAHD